jgi:hypothetical protein
MEILPLEIESACLIESAGSIKPVSQSLQITNGARSIEEEEMPQTKRFKVLLEKDANSEATGILIPFNVEKVFGTRARLPVRGTINGTDFRGTIFPMGQGRHYMVVNKGLRASANVRGGETISVVMGRDDEPRVVTPPADLKRALKANKDAQAAWNKLSYTHRKEYARSVEEAKRPETRTRRIEKSITELTARKKPKG